MSKSPFERNLSPNSAKILGEAEITLAGFFFSNAIAPSTRRHYERLVELFAHWCEALGVTNSPANPTDVLCYLHAHRETWGWSHMYKVVDAIRFIGLENGHPDITHDHRVRAYLSARRKDVGKRAERTLVDPILTEHARIMVMQLQAGSPSVQSTRLLMSLARVLDSLDGIHAIVGEFPVTIESDECATGIRLDGKMYPLDEELSSRRQIAVLIGPGQTIGADDLDALPEQVSEAWRRSGLDGDQHCWRNLPAEDFRWLLAHVDPEYAEACRAVAYLLAGHAMGRRHAEMADLEFKHFEGRAGGWDVLIAQSKTDQFGEGHVLGLEHEFDDGTGCDPVCGACAFEALFEVHVRLRNGDIRGDARVFPKDLTTGARWTTGSASRYLKRWWLASGLDPAARIATRSIRAGTATSLSRRKATIEQIGRVTLHKTPSVLLKYIRRRDPGRWQVHLPL